MTRAAAPALCILAICVPEAPALAMIFCFERFSMIRNGVSGKWHFINADGNKYDCTRVWMIVVVERQ